MSNPASLHTETINDLVEHQLQNWPDAKARYLDLAKCIRRPLQLGDLPVAIQLNPARIVSTAADTSKKGIASRACFLCASNRPPQQNAMQWMEGWDLCINPFPILPIHFTIISTQHEPQAHPPFEMAAMAEAAPDLVIFFNGAKGGASAPDHLHMQGVLKSELPLIKLVETHHPSDQTRFIESSQLGLDLPFNFISAVIPPDMDGMEMMVKIHRAFGVDLVGNQDSGLINVFFWIGDDRLLRAIVIPRRQHRPHFYFEEEAEKRIVVAPGAIDMTGLLIAPRAEDFDKIDEPTLRQIYSEVAFADTLPESITKHFSL